MARRRKKTIGVKLPSQPLRKEIKQDISTGNGVSRELRGWISLAKRYF
jgi:hypothetical protein